MAGICITLAAFILNTVRDIRADMRALLERQDKLAERLGRVEEGQAQLSERLGRQAQAQARMNGVLETIGAGLSYRVERADAGDRVAEDAESYETEG